jgi:hypothetical protein
MSRQLKRFVLAGSGAGMRIIRLRDHRELAKS